ncbi:hypothetical protein HanLR1_Chr12g0433521 [Helianthus annuus]|nr:hypothetical protein HanLR1_Chr12g0433521 [Helianthus annuus]
MNGQNAKTNFPVTTKTPEAGNNNSPVATLATKLKKCCKDPTPSLTCLRLDNDNSHIGVWQKRAGKESRSGWVMKVELGGKKRKEIEKEEETMEALYPITAEDGGEESIEAFAKSVPFPPTKPPASVLLVHVTPSHETHLQISFYRGRE